MRDFNPKLTPLLKELSDCEIGYFLISSEFSYLCVQATWKDYWEVFDSITKHGMRFYGRSAEANIAVESLERLLHECIVGTIPKENLSKILYDIWDNFMLWISERNKAVDFSKAFEYSKLISFDAELLEKLRALHAQKQASLASQTEQQASPQIKSTKEGIRKQVERTNYQPALSELDKLVSDTSLRVRLSELQHEFVSGNAKTDFSQRLLVFIDMVFKDIL